MTAPDVPGPADDTRLDADGFAETSVEDLQRTVLLLDLVPIPKHLEARVLAHVRGLRASLRHFRKAGIDVSATVSAHPFRA